MRRMNLPPIANGLQLKHLTLRDWVDLTDRWLSVRQQNVEAAMRRANAGHADIARVLEDYARRQGTYQVLGDMCKTADGCMMLLERAAERAGANADRLESALAGMTPDEIAVLALQACGFRIAAPTQDDAAGNA
jgi:hypothetical protein